jgi:hypothetical protein
LGPFTLAGQFEVSEFDATLKSVSRRVRSRTRLIAGINGVTKCLPEYCSTTLGFCRMEASPRGDSGFQVRDLQIAYGFTLQTSPLHLRNEIFYRFWQPFHFCRFNNLAVYGFSWTSTCGTLPRATRKIGDAASSFDLPTREFTADDLAIWTIRELSG